ncbi:hypothetical protein BC829DRAFT_405802, partial [Chytridium lagenaria]
ASLGKLLVWSPTLCFIVLTSSLQRPPPPSLPRPASTKTPPPSLSFMVRRKPCLPPVQSSLQAQNAQTYYKVKKDTLPLPATPV